MPRPSALSTAVLLLAACWNAHAEDGGGDGQRESLSLAVDNNAEGRISLMQACTSRLTLGPGEQGTLVFNDTEAKLWVVPEDVAWDCKGVCQDCFYVSVGYGADGAFQGRIGYGSSGPPPKSARGGLSGLILAARHGDRRTYRLICTTHFCGYAGDFVHGVDPALVILPPQNKLAAAGSSKVAPVVPAALPGGAAEGPAPALFP